MDRTGWFRMAEELEDLEKLTAEEKQKKEEERLNKLREDRLFQLKCKYGSPFAEGIYDWEQKNGKRIDE